MVTAGVYLFCRMSFLLVLSPAAMAVVALIGALTALLAALIAFAQDDIKKVLAYSTVSQLGFMFMGVGMGVFWAAVLHLVTHAFFKACLFLGAGSVMHGNGDETGHQEARRPAQGDAVDLGHLPHRHAGHHRHRAAVRLLLEGRHPARRAHDAARRGLAWVTSLVLALGCSRAVHRVLHDARSTSSPSRASAARTRRFAARARERLADDAAAGGAGGRSRWSALVYGVPLMKPAEGGHDAALMENFLDPVFRTARALARNAVRSSVPHGARRAAWSRPGCIAWVIALVGGAVGVLPLPPLPAGAGGPAGPRVGRAGSARWSLQQVLRGRGLRLRHHPARSSSLERASTRWSTPSSSTRWRCAAPPGSPRRMGCAAALRADR